MTATKPITILLVDDDQDDRDFFMIALEDVNVDFSCKMVNGSQIALDMLKRKELDPDFIFLDLNMPGIDGRTCLKHLKENSETAHYPVIIFSTSSEARDIAETKSLGAMHFMTKPSDLSKLSLDLNNFFNQQFLKNKLHEK